MLQQANGQAFSAESSQPLIGIIMEEDGQEVVYYFTDDSDADAAETDADVQAALSVIGAWRNLDWEETSAALDRIRHAIPPTPPIENL
ncbi:MAG: hypothetical protein KIT87_12580 [Anaerolineae bacterium]|nr:hypothetical protein [Anaerolineae bacterium]